MSGSVFEFPPFRADARRRSLSREGTSIPLPRKAFDTLMALLESSGEVVTKEALLKRVWADAFVEENSLNQSISAIRKALGDQAAVPRFIETVPGLGYRFIAALDTPVREQRPQSLAVLPLRVSSREDDALGVGIADTLITRLGNVRSLVVRPTGAVLRYAEATRDATDAGRTLGVDAVLDGGIRRSGDRLRVNVQLVGVESGAAIWAGTFDERFTEIFDVEDSISQRVAEALTTHLSGEERSLLTRRTTENSEAYRLYLKGRWYADRLTREGSERAIECMNQAVALDPNYALGYAGLAHQFTQCADLVMPSKEAMDRAEEAARRALAIDSKNVEAQTSLAVVRWHRDWDRAASTREFERAVELGPRNAYVRNQFGWCLALMGDFERAFEELQVAAEIDPQSHELGFYLIPALYFARRYDEALRQGREAIARDPEFWLMHVIVGRSLEATGDLAGAIAAYERARAIDESILESVGDLGRACALAGQTSRAKKILAELRKRDAPSFTMAMVHLGLGDLDATFAALRDAVAKRSWYVTWLDTAPMLDPIRGEARFARLR